MNAFYTAKKTLRNYANGGNVLILASVLAMLLVNIPGLNSFYNSLWGHEIALQVGGFNLFSHDGHPMSVMAFINDALMAIFFFSVGLEIKREVLVGELHDFRKALLPVIAAIGGMGVPVLIFWAISSGKPYSTGMAIPMATDIAFTLGVLAMLGNRVPVSLKIFLTTLAVVDDIGGILVIAIFYSSHIELSLLLIAVALLGILMLGAFFKIQSKLFYIGIGAFIWFLFLNSGIHPTIAGVLIAFCVPARPLYAPKGYIKTIRRNISRFSRQDEDKLVARTILSPQQMNWLKEIETASDKVISPLQDLEDSLHPVVNYIIVPLFAFANAGIYLGDLHISSIVSGLSLAIIVSLVGGKFIGIFTFSWLCVKLKWAEIPHGCNWHQMGAASLLAGIGFTVSLFIANLSFPTTDPAMATMLNNARLGIVAASLIAGIAGYFALRNTLPDYYRPSLIKIKSTK